MSKSEKRTHAIKSRNMTEEEAEEAWGALSQEGYDVSVVDTRHQGDSK